MSLERLIRKSREYSVSEDYIQQRVKDRQSFVERFPLEELGNLSIDDFVQGTDNQSFCYWLEFKKIGFGIGGGNASKYGIYKTLIDGEPNYVTGSKKSKKILNNEEAEAFFTDLLQKISIALDYARNDQVHKIRTLGIPMWNMVLQKILAIYFPEKFLTIGSADVLLNCANELGLKNIELTSDNSIEVNFECKRTISSNSTFKDWTYEKIGLFIWEVFDGEKIKKNNKSSTQYWLYSPGEQAHMWDEFHESGIMALGWDELGDLTQYKNRSEIKNALIDAYGGKGSKKNDVSANDDFVNKINTGDVIIAKKGRSELLGYGIVESDYIHDETRSNYKNTRKVDWKIIGNWQVNFSLVLKTLTDITEYKTDHPDYDNYYELLLGLMENSGLKDNREEFIFWLGKKYGQESGTVTSYVKAMDLLSQTLSQELFKTTDDEFLGRLYNELIREQRNEDSKYFHKEAPSYGNNGFYSAAVRAYRVFLKPNRTKSNQMKTPLNTILYGPPGTGKTYKLKNEYFDRYSTNESSISSEQFFQKTVSELNWWEVIALAVKELGKTKVSPILNNRWVKEKSAQSESKSIRATIWSQLQYHTVEGCEYVKYNKRNKIQIFNKTSDGYWELVEDQVNEQVPELMRIIDSVNDFKANPDKEIKRYVFTTFHQSYGYEDFIEGIKPVIRDEGDEGDIEYTIEPGIFKKLCSEARNDQSNRYAIFIDEINRGNVSSIFGELITLIEPDKRAGQKNELSAVLPYSKTQFSVPSNVDVYGTMNTADRSVEALDTALRRRFTFEEMMPNYDLLENMKVGELHLKEVLETINERIEVLIDRDHTIGHSYFMNVGNTSELKLAFANKIIPLLQEYFYSDYGKIGLVLGKGFVGEVSKRSGSDNVFASFPYDGQNDFIQPQFKLITIDDSFDVMEAVKTLLNHKPSSSE